MCYEEPTLMSTALSAAIGVALALGTLASIALFICGFYAITDVIGY